MADIKFPSETNSKTTPVGADILIIADSEASNAVKDITLDNVRDNYLKDDSTTSANKFWSSNKIQAVVDAQEHSADDITTGTLPVARWGTGAATHTSGGVLIGAWAWAVTSSKTAPTGDFLGTTDTQTLTNKTIDPSANTIDWDKLDITFTPTNYTPDSAPAEADDVDDLTAHLKGIDNVIGVISESFNPTDWTQWLMPEGSSNYLLTWGGSVSVTGRWCAMGLSTTNSSSVIFAQGDGDINSVGVYWTYWKFHYKHGFSARRSTHSSVAWTGSFWPSSSASYGSTINGAWFEWEIASWAFTFNCVSCDGTTREVTAYAPTWTVSGSTTYMKYISLDIIVDIDNSVVFKVDDVVVATHTTNVPLSSGSWNIWQGYRIASTVVSGYNITLYHNHSAYVKYYD